MSELISYARGQYSGEIEKIRFYEGITFGTTLYYHEYMESNLHYHQNPHISFLLKGSHIEKRNGTVFRRLPGDIMFCHAGEPHQFITNENSKNINIELNNKLLRQLGFTEDMVHCAIATNLDFKFLMLKMYHEFCIGDADTSLSIQVMLYSLITKSDKILYPEKPKWVSILLDVINDKWNETISLNELSAATQVHPITISRYFTKYFSCTLGEYRRKIKISKSLKLIKSSNLTLTEVAYHCGFADQSHFIRTFKEMTGILPKKFAKM